MKKTIRLIALIAFLGSWAVFVITVGGKKHSPTESCTQEWEEAYNLTAKDPKANLTVNK